MSVEMSAGQFLRKPRWSPLHVIRVIREIRGSSLALVVGAVQQGETDTTARTNEAERNPIDVNSYWMSPEWVRKNRMNLTFVNAKNLSGN